MIPTQIIEEIRSKADIVQVVSEYVPIKKRGKNYLGLCPFHAEKDPSFTVSAEKQLFHCFGCNEGGNVFAFLMKIENINFAEAVEELGGKLGIAVPRYEGAGASRDDKERLYQVTLLAAKYFREQLEGPAGEKARAYLDNRGIKEATRKLFGLGFAPEGWDNLFNHLIGRGVSPALIEKSGLTLAREGKSGYYDRFRHRLIFPVIDQRGRALAFGGRALGEEEPKYLNSPDTAIYHKGEVLYGINASKDRIKEKKRAVLVEGNFDLITPFQAGITNIVASMGTALTAAQCKLLARYCDTIVLAFDADAAGGAAAEKSVELLRAQGLNVKVALLTSGKDPDEIVRNAGAEAFKKCLDGALPFLEFKLRRILARHDTKEIEGRARALREIAAALGREADPFVQKEYAKLAAAPLKTDADAVLAEIKRQSSYSKFFADTLRRRTEKPGSKVAEAEKNLIGLAVSSRELLQLFKQQMAVDDFSLPPAKAVAELLLSTEFKEEMDPAHFLLENLPAEEAKNFLSRILVSGHLGGGEKGERILYDCVKVIKKERLKDRIENLKLEIKEAEKAGEPEKAARLLSALKAEIS